MNRINSFSKKHIVKGVTSLFLVTILGLGAVPVTTLAADNTTKILEDEYVDLAKKSGYTVEPEEKVSGKTVNAVRINSQEVLGDALTLKEVGDYEIELICDSITYTYNAVLYRRGDANIDTHRDVKDLVAMCKMDVHTKKSEEYGANFDGVGDLDSNDRNQFRKLLVGKVKQIALYDFASYSGTKEDVNAYSTFTVEKGKTYTLSFNYYVRGEDSESVRLINAAQVWQQDKSDVAFENNKLTGTGTYAYTFEADYTQVIPVFETTVASSAPKFYVWDMQLIEADTGDDKIGEMMPGIFKGDLMKEGLVTVSDADTDILFSLVLPKIGDIVDDNECISISEATMSVSQLSFTFLNISDVWEVEEAYVVFTYYDAEGAKLSDVKAELGLIEVGEMASCIITLPVGAASMEVTEFGCEYWTVPTLP